MESQWYRASLQDLAISRDGKAVAVVGCHGHIKMWNSSTGALTTELGRRPARMVNMDPDRLFHIAFTPDDKHVVVSDKWGRVSFWDIEKGKNVYSIKLPLAHEDGQYYRLVTSPDGRYLCIASDGICYVCDADGM